MITVFRVRPEHGKVKTAPTFCAVPGRAIDCREVESVWLNRKRRETTVPVWCDNRYMSAELPDIQRVLYDYAWGCDEGDWALLRSVISDDAELDYSSTGGPAGSRDEPGSTRPGPESGSSTSNPTSRST
jgi:hypothetical protein